MKAKLFVSRLENKTADDSNITILLLYMMRYKSIVSCILSTDFNINVTNMLNDIK